MDYPLIHNDDIGGRVGEFFGTPVREFNSEDAELRELADTSDLVSRGRKSPSKIPAPTYTTKNYNDAFIAFGALGVSINRRKEHEIEQANLSFYDTREVSIEEAKALSESGEMIVWRPSGARTAQLVEGMKE